MMVAMRCSAAACLAILMVLPSVTAQQPSWSSQVAAIVYRSCAPCHRPGHPAPFSLLSYDDFFKKRKFAVEVIEAGYMPPWQPTHGAFVGDRRLSKQDIAV